MEPFVVSARKYRPQTFKDVVGQKSITDTLTNAIENNHLAQALLFCGPRGVGKTTCARILAKNINQDSQINADEDFAFNIFELDAASNNSVDDIRNLTDQVRIPPQVGKYKVYIIDEVHMLSQSAFNAFLKTLEEPPKHAIFILATTEKHKIIPTILSRCQIFDFKRITVKDASEYLKYIAEQQGIIADEDALHIIAQKADGAMRDALSIFDRVVSFAGKNLTRKAVTENLNVLDYDTYFKATDLILENNIPDLLVQFNKILALGFDGHHFISGLASHFRDLMVCRHEQTIELLEVGETAKKKYGEQAKRTSSQFLLKAIDLANDCDLKYRTSKNQRLLVELTLMKLASLDFSGEKKNPESIALADQTVELVPAYYFKSRTTHEAKTQEEIPITDSKAKTISNELSEKTIKTPEKRDSENKPETNKQTAEALLSKPVVKKIGINIPAKKVSGLSISSLKAKKQHELNRKDVVIDPADLPKDPFTEKEMRQHWSEFVKKLEAKGQKILASSLSTDLPKLKDSSTIYIEMPNATMKTEIEREQYEIMEFLKGKLNNYDIKLAISVDETAAKKYAFTPEEKYQKLREKNPAIDLLRKEFDLDI